jgi:acetyl-CoA C-acetyltransferase
MSRQDRALVSNFGDAWLLDGCRTPFVDYTGALAQVSPTDLGIKVARSVIAKAGITPKDVDTLVAGNLSPGSFDAFFLPRHIALYAGLAIETPAHLVQRLCGTGLEALIQAGDLITAGKIDLALTVGTESMSRNPVAAFTHRTGFRLGQVEFKDFLWEALTDTACPISMGGTAENLAKKHDIAREAVDAFAARSFARAITAQKSGFLAGEIVPVTNETFAREGFAARGIRLATKDARIETDSHIRPTDLTTLAAIRPAFGGVQTGGNSSAIVDGAAAGLVASGSFKTRWGKAPLARLVAGASVGVAPSHMGIGPVPAIRAVLDASGKRISDVARVEINEAFGAQVMACGRELGLDEDRLNVNGGAIAIGHPLAATGVRLAITLARELKRAGQRYGIASACIGGGQGIALLIENPEAS